MTRDGLVKLIRKTNGRLFRVEFVKRTTGELRLMNARLGVKAHLKGGKPAYDFAAKGLIPVFEFGKNDYRSIPVEGIVRVKFGGQWYEVENEQLKAAA